MAGSLWRTLRSAILWSYKRGSWQYDIMVGLILAFVFLTPRSWFRDQPRIPGAQHIVMLPNEGGRTVFWLDPDMIADPAGDLNQQVRAVLERRTGRKLTDLQTEPSRDSEGRLNGYVARARF
jgi:hypothetical protein